MKPASKSVIFNHGNFFAGPIIIVGYFMLGINLIAALAFNYEAFVLFPIGLIICFNRVGVEINTETSEYRHYFLLARLRIGTWKDLLSDYPDISLLKITERRALLSGLSGSITEQKTFIHVVLLNHNHRKKMLLVKCNNKENADIVINDLREQTHLNYTKYQPKLSRKSQSRKNQRRR